MTTLALHRPSSDSGERLFPRCIMVSAVLGAVFLVAVILAPVQRQVITKLEQLPPRFAKLILKQPEVKPLPAGDVTSANPGGGKPGRAGAPGEPAPGPRE